MPAQVDKKTGQKLPDSNELLNIILIVLGIIFIIQGVLLFLGLFGVSIPTWLSAFNQESGTAVSSLLGQTGLVTIVLGVWAFVAGVGMFQEQEWAWGQALVVLSIIFVNTVGIVIGWIMGSPFVVGSITTWITIVGFVISIVGFFWLIFTKKRYA